jgi:hypothetical protein
MPLKVAAVGDPHNLYNEDMLDVKHNVNNSNNAPSSPKLSHGLKVRTVRPNPTIPRWVWILLGALALALVIFGILFWRSQHQVNELRDSLDSKVNATKIAEENKALLDRVGAVIILPDDETPTIATVSDLDKLKGQPFFAKAELGDKVLIYAKAKKAILYRPSTNKIVELAFLTDSGDPGTISNSNSNLAPSNNQANQ